MTVKSASTDKTIAKAKLQKDKVDTILINGKDSGMTMTQKTDGRLILDTGPGDNKIHIGKGKKPGTYDVEVDDKVKLTFSRKEMESLTINSGKGRNITTVDTDVDVGLRLNGGSVVRKKPSAANATDSYKAVKGSRNKLSRRRGEPSEAERIFKKMLSAHLARQLR
jgi:hypothetical protein